MVVRALTRLARDSTALTRMARHVRHSRVAARHTTISKQSYGPGKSSVNSSSDLQTTAFLFFFGFEFRQAPSVRTLLIQEMAGNMHKDSVVLTEKFYQELPGLRYK
jgi:hypothetical protein